MINFDSGQLEMICLPKSVAEELIGAPPACLKLYIYTLMRRSSDLPLMCEELNMPLNEVEDALQYLKERGMLLSRGAEKLIVTLPALEEEEELIYTQAENSATLQALFTDRILSSREYSKIRECTTVYGLPKEVVLRLVEHCITTSKAKNHVSMNSILQKASEWSEAGIDTIELAEKRVKAERSDSSNFKELLMRLGMRNRNATTEEKKIYTKWTVEYGMDIDAVYAALPATLSAREPSVKYLDSILTRMFREGRTTAERITEALSDNSVMDKQIKNLLECIGYRRHTVTDDIRRMYNRFMSMGFTEEAILMAGRKAMLDGAPSINSVDTILSGWSSRGAITVAEIETFLKNAENAKQRAAEYLNRMGVTKPVSDMDIAMLNKYVSKGTEEDVLFFAAELAYGAASPEKLAKTILKNWAASGVKTLEEAKRENEKHKLIPRKTTENEREYTREEIKSKLRDPLEEF